MSRCAASRLSGPAFAQNAWHTHTHKKSNSIVRIFRGTFQRHLHGLEEHFIWVNWLQMQQMLGQPFSSPSSPPQQFLGGSGSHFLFIIILSCWQKLSVIPPDFIPCYLANVDSPPSSHMSHVESQQPLMRKKKIAYLYHLANPLGWTVPGHQSSALGCCTQTKPKEQPLLPLSKAGGPPLFPGEWSNTTKMMGLQWK